VAEVIALILPDSIPKLRLGRADFAKYRGLAEG
jgi:hypothetical protein